MIGTYQRKYGREEEEVMGENGCEIETLGSSRRHVGKTGKTTVVVLQDAATAD